jgi:NAD(P)-dependent dehydrogenase (short-subunit alcohol dehydrogenase family)
MSKVWFITGSSRGLGRSFAEAALARSDKVAATARDVASLDALTRYGDAVLPLLLDVTDKAAVFDAVRQARQHFGRLDVVVNNAGYGLFGAVEELSDKDLRDQMETNLFGPLWVVQAALPIMREQGGGHIIQISSTGGQVSLPLGGGYHASKFALEGLSDSLAQEVAGFGIKVTVVEPSFYATDGAAGAVNSAADPLYHGVRESFVAFAKTLDVGDPAAAGRALLKLADSDDPPLRVFFGTEGLRMARLAYADRLKSWAEWEDLSAEAH